MSASRQKPVALDRPILRLEHVERLEHRRPRTFRTAIPNVTGTVTGCSECLAWRAADTVRELGLKVDAAACDPGGARRDQISRPHPRDPAPHPRGTIPGGGGE